MGSGDGTKTATVFDRYPSSAFIRIYRYLMNTWTCNPCIRIGLHHDTTLYNASNITSVSLNRVGNIIAFGDDQMALDNDRFYPGINNAGVVLINQYDAINRAWI